jgi:cytochrome o ubiquinol oxidase subunit II
MTELNLLASDPGVYQGISAQFSGDGFSDMRFEVRALSGDQYQSWLNDARRGSEQLDAVHYAQLVKPSQGDTPRVFSKVTPGLFDAVVASHGELPALAASAGTMPDASR